MPVILATQEAEIRKIVVWSQTQQIFEIPYLKKTHDMELYNIILSEVRLAQKTQSYVLPHMRTLDQEQTQQGDWTLITW
jgi:hypothetical protein